MAVTLPQKRALLWGVGILLTLVLINLAWAQIAALRCFSFF